MQRCMDGRACIEAAECLFTGGSMDPHTAAPDDNTILVVESTHAQLEDYRLTEPACLW